MIHFYRIPVGILLCLATSYIYAEDDLQRTIYDSNGFKDITFFPLGPLQNVSHGKGQWHPASGSAVPGEIVEFDASPFQRGLRRFQTANQPIDVDYLDFPPVASATLTISFDARVSTTDSRTLDIFLLRPGHTHTTAQASVLIWGYEPGHLSYFDGQYHRLAPINTEWNHYEIRHNLSENTFDLIVNAETIGSGLTWRNRFAPDTEFGRLRIGSIRGNAGEYADITNLRITSSPTPPAINISAPLAPGGLVSPSDGFQFQIIDEKPESIHAVEIMLNDNDVSENVLKSVELDSINFVYLDLEPDSAYKASITASNDFGTSTRDISFYTYTNKVDGYRGIWFTLGQMSGVYGDKYSAGSAFAWPHTLTPMAVYAPEVDKTFFVYGGVTDTKERYLLIMASYYDHANHRVPQPTIVRDQLGVDDPHDNPSLTIDPDGYIWVFIAGRGRARPGQIFRSTAPYSIEEFELMDSREQTYSQIWTVPEKGFFHLLTKYTHGRELYWETSRDGNTWSEQNKLAGFGGHYQVSRLHNKKVGTAFNYHPGGNVDRRTNLYYMETSDFGDTWSTIDGQSLETPLNELQNAALITDYETQGKNVYILKLLFDSAGHPAILYLTSSGFAPGPDNAPRSWKIARWDGGKWITSHITDSDHNYDVGSFYINEDHWALIAPALTGPQPYHTGGEVGLWISTDQGANWKLDKQVTENSPFNHSYLRRPHNPAEPFYCLWADGDSSQLSISRLFFTNSDGSKLYMLPYTMDTELAEPSLLDPPVPPKP